MLAHRTQEYIFMCTPTLFILAFRPKSAIQDTKKTSLGKGKASGNWCCSAATWKRRRRHQRCSSTAARRRRVCSAISAASGVCGNFVSSQKFELSGDNKDRFTISGQQGSFYHFRPSRVLKAPLQSLNSGMHDLSIVLAFVGRNKPDQQHRLAASARGQDSRRQSRTCSGVTTRQDRCCSSHKWYRRVILIQP